MHSKILITQATSYHVAQPLTHCASKKPRDIVPISLKGRAKMAGIVNEVYWRKKIVRLT